MNRLLLGNAVILVSTVLAAPAFAADMPVKAPPRLTAPASYNWNGCYFGGNAGGKSTSTSGTIDVFPPIVPSTTSFALNGGNNSGSFIGGGQFGCNYQSGQFVFGMEGDADAQHLSRSGALAVTSATPGVVLPGTVSSFSLTSNWQASLRARVGVASDRVLWYATAGAAWTHVDLAAHTTFFGDAPVDITTSKTVVGGTAGVGVEFAVGNQLTLGLEARHTWYGNSNRMTGQGLGPSLGSSPATANLNLNTTEVIGKVNFKLPPPELSQDRRAP
jgi:outer membrane immunogenic protein